MNAIEKYQYALKLYVEQNQRDTTHKIAGLLYQSAYSGCAEAQFVIAHYGLNCFCQNSETPEYWYEKAASQGHPHAQYCLAMTILDNAEQYDGECMERAINLLTKAANGGNTSAAFLLHHVYNLGLWDIDIDIPQSDHWLQVAKHNRSQYEQKREHRKADSDCIEPDDWDLEFHKDSVYFLSEIDIEKWRRYVLTQMIRK